MGRLDRNARDDLRQRRNAQRTVEGAVTGTLALKAGDLVIDGNGDLALAHPFVVNETPSGTINGSNTIFLLAMAPRAGTLLLMVNGLTQVLSNDYTLSTNQITFLSGAIPTTGDSMRATYEA